MKVHLLVTAHLTNCDVKDKLNGVFFDNATQLCLNDLFRQELSSESERSDRLRSYINAGKLVPDNFINDLLLSFMEEEVENGSVTLKGYPRNLGQLALLEESLANSGWTLGNIVHVKPDFAAISASEKFIAEKVGAAVYDGRWIERVEQKVRYFEPLVTHLRFTYADRFVTIEYR